MTTFKTLIATLAVAFGLAWIAGLLTPVHAAQDDACARAPSTTAWLACRARREHDPRLCSAILDTTFVHFCEESAGAGGCASVLDPTMKTLCIAGAEIR
jgi:hypothetical protein